MSTDSSGVPVAKPRSRRARLFLLTLVLLVPLAGAAVAAMLIPTELIARAAAQRAEAALGLPVTIGDLQIDFWPVPSVALLGARLGPEGEPVASVDRILLRPRLLPLFAGRVTVREIAIDRPDIRIVVDSAGALNLPFSRGAEGTQPASSEGEVEFAVDEFRIRDGRLSYRDDRDGTEVVLTGLQQALRIAGRVDGGTLARVGLSGRLSSDSVDAILPLRLEAPLHGVRFAIDHDAELDREADRLDFDSITLGLQEVVLSGAGRIEALTDSLGRRAMLELRAEEFGFDDLARSLPEGFLSSLLVSSRAEQAAAPVEPSAAMEYAGRAAIAARVAGPITRDSIPQVEGAIQLRQIAVRRGGSPVLSETAGRIEFSNEALGSRDLAGTLFGGPFSLEVRVADFASPVVTFATKGTAQAAELLSLVESDEPVRASGALPFDLHGHFRSADPEAPLLEGTIGLGGVHLELPSLLQPVVLASGTLRFAGEVVRLEGVDLAFGESRVQADATVEDWLASTLGDSTALALVRFDARAGLLDLDALLGPSESEYTPLLFARLADRPVNGRSAAEAAAELGFQLPELPRLRAEGEVRAERLVRNGAVYDQVEVSVESSPSAVSVPRLRFGMMGGTVSLGLALEREDSVATLLAIYHLENVGAGEFFSRFTPFQGKLSGLLTMDGEASLQLDRQLLPVRPTVRSSGRVALTSGSLASWPLLAAVGERLGLQSFDTLAFREWRGDFLIAGPLVSLERSLQVSDRVETELAGSFDFGGKLDLGVVARLSPELVAGAGDQVQQVAASLTGAGGELPVGLRITGTAAAPVVALDMTAARDEALARARDRASEEARSAARRAATEVARQALGDSVATAPAQLGEAVRSQVQDRLRGLLGGRAGAPVSGAPAAAPGAAPDSLADSATGSGDSGQAAAGEG